MTDTPFKILAGERTPSNFFAQDPFLAALLERLLPAKTRAWLWPQLDALGRTVPGYVEERSAVADREWPKLKQFDRYGQRIDEVVVHPAYRDLERVAYGSGMIGHKYDATLRAEHGTALQVAGFALAYLYAQAECGVSCPACMTDGVARVLELHGSAEQKAAYIPRLASRDLATLARGAMFLTEKQGGSDVGANATRAVKQSDGTWKLYGEKWFCSNVDGEVALVLARPEGAPEGTKGLGLFLLPHRLADGTRNAKRIDRLKDKLGVRSMPSGEVVLEGAVAELVGEPGAGFKQMAEMLNLSRLWNAVCSVAIMRRAIHESTEYLRLRRTFGKRAVEHGLVREVLADLNAEEIGNKVLVLTLAQHLADADAGDETAKALVRMLTPLTKYWTAKGSVWAASEGIELLGGNGYIEDSPMPRLLRDAQVLPVWEGTTNILVLDGLRVVAKTAAHEVLFAEVKRRTEAAPAPFANEAAEIDRVAAKALEGLMQVASEGPDAGADLLKKAMDRIYLSYELALLLELASDGKPGADLAGAALRRLIKRHVTPEARSSSADVTLLVDRTVG